MEFRIEEADEAGIKLAIRYLKTGKAVVYPTDTAYALGVDATNLKAVKRLYKIKGRSFKKPIHVIVTNYATAQNTAIFNKFSEKIFKKFLPGPLTLVLELRIRNQKSWKVLSANTGTIGIRMPDNRFALALVKKFGKPITTTSANLSGGKTPYTIREAVGQFESRKHQPDLYMDAGKLPRVKPSTIVKVGNNKIKVLREGPLSLRQIQQAIETK